MENVLARFKNIRCFVFDMDGVLTDGSLLVLPNGVWARRMNIKDGYALQLAVKKGYEVIIISGSNSDEVKERLNRLGITNVHMNIKDKAALLQQINADKKMQQQEILCMGDDIPDLEILNLAGVACCPADAVSEIKSIAHYISPVKGGEGCVRDVIEKVLKLNGDWNNDTSVASK